MPKYNLNSLGSEEFERLCQSLIQKVIGPGAKVYGMGSDGSREATFNGKAPYPSETDQWEGNWIFQAKFHDIEQIGPAKARSSLLVELDDELLKITQKYKHPCDNYILLTNVILTPVCYRGIKDRIDNEVIPRYRNKIKNIHVWGADEICRFLDSNEDIRKTYANFLVSSDIIARLLGLIEKKGAELDEIVSLYCQGCFVHEETAALDDAGDIEDKPVELKKVFIDLDVKPPELDGEPRTLEGLPVWLRQAASDRERTSGLSYLLDDSILGLVLVGGPGEGKSTLGQYIAQIHRARLIGKLNELSKDIENFEKCTPRIPFRVLLRDYAQWVSSQQKWDSLFHYLLEHISQEAGKDINTDHIHDILKANPIMLILDGLDEVPEKKLRTKILSNISSFVHQVRDVLKGDLRIIATTRPYGYSDEFDPKRYLHLTLRKLAPEKALLYATRWIKEREPNPKKAETILATLDICLNDKVVRILTQTPLQVTILLVIIRARGTPPKQREELFESYLDIIYQREQKKRPELLQTEKDVVYGLHKYLGYILHRRAEKDKTAALMDDSEFEGKVREYFRHKHPLLKQNELESKVNQIIAECRTRLVLIESPQGGKIGFSLTTIREFFAAAHLVDTAKEIGRDKRFRAIAKSPYWRNVALFFAGRVGRTRPAEASSLVDVCREIDTDGLDKYLKRGAELVIDLLDDRALRLDHHEIGAIQYGLSLLDRGYIRDFDDLINKLESLPEIFKERVILPILEKKLRGAVEERFEIYVDVYERLFGMDQTLHAAIRKATRSRELNAWAIAKAFKNKITDPWVITNFKKLVDDQDESVTWVYWYIWPNIRLYLNLPLTSKLIVRIAGAMFEGLGDIRSHYELQVPKIIDNVSQLKQDGVKRLNHLYLWAVRELLAIAYESVENAEFRRSDLPLGFRLPGISNPLIKQKITNNRTPILDFIDSFSTQNEVLTSYLVRLYEFLLNPANPKKYLRAFKDVKKKRKNPQWLARINSQIFGLRPGDEEKLDKLNEELKVLCELYNSIEDFRKDSEEINKIINRTSQEVKDHPQKLFVWVISNFDQSVEKYLDQKILTDLNDWLEKRGLTKYMISFGGWRVEIIDEIGNLEFTLRIYEDQVKNLKKPLKFRPIGWFLRHKWNKPMTARESQIANRFKHIFNNILIKFQYLEVEGTRDIETLYWVALGANIIDERDMIDMYKIVCRDSDFPSMYWYARECEHAEKFLVKMMKSNNEQVACLAGVSLLAILKGQGLLWEHNGKGLKGERIGAKFFELAENKDDPWCPKYIEGMSYCILKWHANSEKFTQALKVAESEEVQNAWCSVIKRAGCRGQKDGEALLNFLINMLESGKTFPMSITMASFERLYELAFDSEPIGFDEKSLNLPLPSQPEINL